MRKLITTLAIAGVLGSMAPLGAIAAPVPGYEAQYTAVVTACTLPSDSLPDCEASINNYAGDLVGIVDLAVANESFVALRAEVFAANEPDEPFQEAVDALFELLLPDSGAIIDDLGPDLTEGTTGSPAGLVVSPN